MTLKITLSQVKSLLPLEFEHAVADYIKAKKHHQTTEGAPAPSAHAAVEAAVRCVPGSIEENRADDFVADYEILDDTPSLDQRKMALALRAGSVAQAAIDTLMPPLKRRLLNMDVARAMAFKESDRTPANVATIAAHQDRTARIDAISYHLAQVEAQIHDLTEATIDAFVAEPFPN